MTLQNIRLQLIRHFCDKDTLSSNEFDEFKVDNSLLGIKTDLIQAALVELREMGICREVVVGKIWMLTNPIENMRQELTLSLPVCVLLADTIETFFQANNMKYEKINPFNISEAHIITVIQILGDILDKGTASSESSQQ